MKLFCDNSLGKGEDMERKKKLPIGIEYFEDFKRDDFYYVDKTGFIRDLVNSRGSVNLFAHCPGVSGRARI